MKCTRLLRSVRGYYEVFQVTKKCEGLLRSARGY